MMQLYIATEDALSEAVADRLVAEVNQGLQVVVRIGRKGNSYLRKRFPELGRTARSIPVLLLTDLDSTDSAPTLLGAWSPGGAVPEGMLFRVVVREIEAWLLADRKGFADFFKVPKEKIPENPETIDDPKQFLLHLIRSYSNKESKAAILPERGSKARIGLGYNQILSRFVEEGWSIRRAAATSDSLMRTFQRLAELSEQSQGN